MRKRKDQQREREQRPTFQRAEHGKAEQCRVLALLLFWQQMHEAEEASKRSRIRSIILSGCDSECSYAMLCMAMFISRGL